MRTGIRAHDLGVLSVMLQGLINERLPRLHSIKRRLENGERLNDWNIACLQQSFNDARRIEMLLERDPEYRDLVARLLHPRKEIADKALENERT